ANEASSPAVKDTLLGILTEEHEIQHRVFTEMARRGWYETEAAEENKIEQAKTKFSGDTGSC
ncbi:MAG: spore coat protein, partial [Clostridia bacterium]|nr:spore coat protein [Clostridia bacterium]